MRTLASSAAVAILLGASLAPVASAQPLGTYRWQLQPYCNIVSLAVTQQGGQYQLDGTDDQCNAAQAASVRGMAFQNPNGTIGFGLTIVTTPGGAPVHVDATIAIATLNGTWRDSAGNNGTFIFTPGGGTGGAPRPVPSGGLAPGSVTMVQIAPGAVGNSQIAANAVTGAHVANGSLTSADLLDSPRAAFASGEAFIDVTGNQVVRSLSIDVPAAGRVIVYASGTLGLTGSSTTNDFIICSITTGTTTDSAHQIAASDGGQTFTNIYDAFGATRGFDVSAGTFTVNLVCTRSSGSVAIADPVLTAIFTP